jgi:hypothetical protein
MGYHLMFTDGGPCACRPRQSDGRPGDIDRPLVTLPRLIDLCFDGLPHHVLPFAEDGEPPVCARCGRDLSFPAPADC